MGAVSLALAFYLVIANAGYATFGASIHSDVLTCGNRGAPAIADGGASTTVHRWLGRQLAPGCRRRDAIALDARRTVALEVTSAIPLQLHPSRECIKSLLQRDAPPRLRAHRRRVAVPAAVVVPGRRRPARGARDVEHVAITLGFLAGALAAALSVRSLGKVLSLVGATGSTTISYITPGGIYGASGRRGQAAPRRWRSPRLRDHAAALTFVFLQAACFCVI